MLNWVKAWFKPASTAATRVKASSVVVAGDTATVDVRGQTCPGYLLAINRAVDSVPSVKQIRLLITYPPCGDDVQAWCKAKQLAFKDLQPEGDHYVISVNRSS